MPFDTFDLIASKYKALNEYKDIASNPYKVLIVLSENEEKDLQTSLLPNILKAVNIDIEKEAIILNVPAYSINILDSLKDLKITKVIAFGISPKRMNLNLNAQKYNIMHIKDYNFLLSDSLSLIANNQDCKKELWASLQTLFLNKL